MCISGHPSAYAVILVYLFISHVNSNVLPENWRDYLPAGSLNRSQPFQPNLFEGEIFGHPVGVVSDTAHMEGNRRWENKIVHYEIAEAFGNIDAILRAMREIESKSCVKFHPRRSHTKDYLSIISGKGCWSSVGRNGGNQLLSLQKNGGCMAHGIIIHELLHALGFYHEQSRSDRDEHVTIFWNNIEEDYRRNFQKDETNNLNTPYDINSIMHYDVYQFAKNSSTPSILPKKTGSKIGQRDGLSSIDVERINKFYECGNIIPDAIKSIRRAKNN